jgi:hypothetical protein
MLWPDDIDHRQREFRLRSSYSMAHAVKALAGAKEHAITGNRNAINHRIIIRKDLV